MREINMQEQEYIETELGLLPEEWKIFPISDLFEFTKKLKNIIIDKNEIIPFIPMELISEYYKVADWQLKKYAEISNGTFVLKNDLLISKITPCFENGKQAILNNIPSDYAYATTEVWALHPKIDNVINEYLYEYLKIPRIRSSLAVKMEGTTGRQRLPRSVLSDLKIPLPPLSEQHNITYILSKVQETKEKTENLLQSLREFKKSLLKYLYSYGPVSLKEVDSVVLKETEIGVFHDEWKIVKFEDVANINGNNRNPAKENPTNSFIYIDIASIESGTGRILKVRKILGKDSPSRARRVVRTNDVILSTVRPYLKAFTIIPEEYDNEICSTGFAVLRAKEKIDSKYLLYVAYTDFVGRQFENLMRGSNYPALNVGHVKNTKIPLPPLPIQQKISLILSIMNNRVAKEHKRMYALDEMYKSMLYNLMTAKIRVNN